MRERRRFLAVLAVLALSLAGTEVSWAAANGDYRSAATGNWSTVGTWERYNGAAWVAAVATPSSTDGAINILNGHIVTVTGAVTIDQTTVDAGGQLDLNSGVTLTIANGAGTDLSVNGTSTLAGTVTCTGTVVDVAGTLTVSGAMTMGTASSIFTANSGANVSISGTLTLSNTSPDVTINSGGAITVTGTLNESGGNPGLTVNSGGTLTNSGGTVSLASVSNVQVTGNLTMSGAASMTTTRGNGGNTVTINSGGVLTANGTSSISIDGNSNNSLTVSSGGTLAMASGATVVGVGDFVLSSGATLKIGSTVGITADPATTGNIQQTGGTRTFNAGAHYEYNGTSAQVFGNGLPTTLTGNLTISNTAGVTLGSITENSAGTVTVSGLLVCGTNTIGGTGAFTLSSGATLQIGSTAGITSAGATGNIQVSGARSFSTSANYTYNGSAAQATGNGLPATVNNLTLSSSGIVTLTSGVTVNGTLSITSAALDQGAANNVTAAAVSISSGATYLNTGTGDLTLAGNLTNAGALRFDGGGTTCGDADSIAIGSSDTTQRSWSGAGKFYLQDLTVSRMGGTRDVVAHSSTDGGNNGSNWIISTGCSGTTEAKVLSIVARRMGPAGVVVEWETGRELDNLGFHLWREEWGRRERVTPELVAGSAFFAGEGMELTAGKSYRWVDEDGAMKPWCQYWLEEVALSGKSTWHGPAEEVKGTPQEAVMASLSIRRLGAARKECGQLRQRGARADRAEGPKARSLLRKKAQGRGSSSEAAPDLGLQWSLAESGAVKIGVREQGWYRVRWSDIVAAGLESRGNLRFLKLVSGGKEVPLLVPECRGGGCLQEAIEFYGEGIDTPATDTRIYWFAWGKKPGKRIATLSGTWGRGRAENSFPFEVERKEQGVYFAAVQNGEGQNFFGPVISGSPVEVGITAHHLDPEPPGAVTVSVAIQGVTTGAHRLKVSFNGRDLGLLEFEGRTRVEESWEVEGGLLTEGENHLELLPQGEERDVSAVDWVRLTYWHTFTADEDRLECAVSGSGTVTIGGFQDGGIRVVDVTRPEAVRLLNGRVLKENNGTYAVRLSMSGPRKLLVVSGAGMLSAAEVKQNQPSRWHGAENEGDEVMVCEGRFVESVEPLAALRRREGLKVSVVDVEDIYDEFGFGEKSAEAVKAFLDHARSSWRSPPRYVLLVGDGSFDPRNRLGLGEWDLVPAKLVHTSVLETASDEWYVDFDGDGVGEMGVGRLPVRTVEEAEGVVGKIVSCGQSRCGNAERVMMVADQNAGFDFEGASGDSRESLPGDMSVEEVFRGRLGTEVARSEVLAGLGEGCLAVNYLGHGSVGVWSGNVLTAKDAPSLSTTHPTVFVLMTCLNGFYHDLYSESMAEALLLRSGGGGASAVWASTGMSEPLWQAELNREFLEGLFKESLTLGEAATRAKSLVPDPDVRATWTLFGDPAMKVR